MGSVHIASKWTGTDEGVATGQARALGVAGGNSDASPCHGATFRVRVPPNTVRATGTGQEKTGRKHTHGRSSGVDGRKHGASVGVS
jgi:hypothetical protein